MGQADRAVQELEAITALNGARAQDGWRLVTALLQMQSIELAAEKAAHFFRLFPDDPELGYLYGTALCALGRFKEALQPLWKVVRLRPEYVSAWLQLSACYRSMENFVLCLHLANTVIQLAPDISSGYEHAGYALLALRCPAAAKRMFSRGLDTAPEIPALWHGLGKAYEQMGNNGSALACYGKAMELAPEDLSHTVERIRLLYRLERFTEALESACAVEATAGANRESNRLAEVFALKAAILTAKERS